MPNDIKLGDSHPATEDKYPLKVGGEVSSLEIAKTGNGAKVTGDLEVTGNIDRINSTNLRINDSNDITLAPRGNNIYFNNGSNDLGEIDMDTLNTIKLQSSTDKHLNLVSQGTGDVVIDSSGDVVLDSADGNFITKKNGTEFSPSNSSYSGMILGYTRIANNSTTNGHQLIAPDATLTVMQTGQGTDVSVTFKAPPSGNVEIQMSCLVYASSKTLEFALSDNASFNEIDETHTYDTGTQSSDETDFNMTTISFVNTGLTPGTSYERWIAVAETVSGTSFIYHGRNRTAGTHYPPIIVKAIALPGTIVTGE